MATDEDSARRQVNDPSTTAEQLADIAYDHPYLTVEITRHPNAYPGLIEWLNQYGVPPEHHASGSETPREATIFDVAPVREPNEVTAPAQTLSAAHALRSTPASANNQQYLPPAEASVTDPHHVDENPTTTPSFAALVQAPQTAPFVADTDSYDLHGKPRVDPDAPMNIMAVLAIICCLGWLGIVFGVIAKRQIRTNLERGWELARWGIILGSIFTVLTAALIAFNVGITLMALT
ncbi:DUF4190 domain-containing protein [Lysinibacter sp. HNR]|uniref:DUF4190 domain-containing protein n=1 Tax=Lysinibacter sp. HNR TaxID=3031408 RepID=UPI002434B9EF|nr:DUF4190 domain-containing protein [Lysinibacter sp. HNR]WGD38001.1 DUF4190 domain-containing protein [Lysinibacter sp. HNR]